MILLSLQTLVALGAGMAAGHDLHHELGRAEEAISVRLFVDHDHPFAFEGYEVYRGGEGSAFQTGRTDALGRLIFLPDRAGMWRVKVFSEINSVDQTVSISSCLCTSSPARSARHSSTSIILSSSWIDVPSRDSRFSDGSTSQLWRRNAPSDWTDLLIPSDTAL